jgi:hypothetical protein
MTPDKRKAPDFIEEDLFDPVSVATGNRRPGRTNSSVEEKKLSSSRGGAKKKAGFYLSSDLLERFSRTFYTLKLEGLRIENKSTLLEAALKLALDDIDRGGKSVIRKLLTGK